MANPPTYVGTTNSTVAWPGNNVDTKSTGSVLSGSTGDVLVTLSGDFNLTTQSFAASSSPSETWTNNTKTGGGSNADSLAQTATAVLSANRSGMSATSVRSPAQSSLWNFVVAQFSGSDGVGANAATTGNGQGAVSLTITTQYDNSAIVYLIMDWSDDGNAARTHRTPSGGSTPIEIGHFNNSSDGSATWAYIADAGAAGAKVVGMSAPTGRDQVMAAVEVRGTVNIGPAFDDTTFDGSTFYTSDVTTTPVTKTYNNTWNANSQVSKTYANTWNVNSQVTKTYATTANVRSVVSRTYAGTWNVSSSVTKAYSQTWTVNANISKSYANTWNARAFATKSYAGTWNVAAQVSKATTIDWAVRTLASKTYASTWNIKAQVTNSYAQTWNVAADSPLTQVSKTYSSTWNVASLVSRTYDSTWNDNSAVSKTYAQTWNVSQSITKTYASTWNVAGAGNTWNLQDIIGTIPNSNATNDNDGVNLGTEFYVTAQAWVTKLRWYQTTTGTNTSDRTIALYRVDSASSGTMVAGPFTSTPSGIGWQSVDLPTAYELTPNQRYRVVTFHPAGRYTSSSAIFAGSNYTSGIVVVPSASNATGGHQGSFLYSSSIGFTNNAFGNSYYFTDVTVTDTNPSGSSQVTKTYSNTWNTNSDKLYSLFPSEIDSWGSIGPSYSDSSSPGGSWGLIFAVSGSCHIAGIRWYSPVAKSGAHLYLWDKDAGTLLKDQDNYELAVGWNELLFDTEYIASPGVTYTISMWSPGSMEYTYTADDRWGGTKTKGNIYTTVTFNTLYSYNQTEPVSTYPSFGSSAKWAGMDVVEALPVEETFDPTFGSTVALENAKDGSPSSNWMITGAGDTTNIGFTENFHYNKGTDSAINFKCHGTGTKLSIYRVGYYQGHGARKVAELTNTATTQGSATTISSSEGSIEFNWTTTATWTLPSDVMSGLYFAYYHNTAETNGSWIPFVIEDKARDADVVLKTADFTWYGAYNYCGDLGSILTGKSLYGSGGPLGSISTRHFIGSYHRPCVTREGVPQTYWRNAESPLIMFLEEQGIDVKYTSSIGLDQDRSGIDGKASTLICQGHDEYWSDGMWDNATYLRDHGTNLVFMSGNENFWRVFWDHTNKRMTCRKDTMAGPGSHVAGTPFIDAANWTGTWRDTRWTNRKPENTLTGTWFDMNGVVDKTHVVNAATYGSHVAWRNTTVATGTNLSLPRVVGFEADSYMPTQPSGSYSLITAETFNIDGGKADVNGETYAELGSFAWGIVAQRYPTSLVVGFGTCQWSWGLIGVHDRTNTTPNINARQMTLNLLADLGALPTTTASGLTTPTPVSLDNYGAIPLTPVTKSSSSTWNSASVVTSAKATNWNTSQQVTQSSAQTWNVAGSLFTVNKTSASTWNINAGVAPKTESFAWTVNTLVSKSYAPTWNVNNVVSKTYNLTWNDSQAVSTSKATSWNILSGVTAKTYANTWNINQSINKNYAVAWNARTAVTKAYAQLWNTFAIGSVSKAYQVNWNVIAKVSSGNSQLWNVRTALVKSYAQAWAVNQAVLKSYANAWNVRAIAAKSAQFSWNVFQVASNQTNFNWEVYSLVNKNTLSSWSVRARVIKESEAQWVVRQVVNNEIDFEWGIFITAARQYSNNWIVSGGVIKQYSTTWNVNEDNKWYIKEPDGTFTLLRIAGIWNGTQVVPV